MKRKTRPTPYDNRPYKKVRATAKSPYVQSPVPRSMPSRSFTSLPATQLVTSSSEVKSLDIPLAVAALNGTGSLIALNLIRAGSSFYNRIGRKIEMKNLQIEMRLRCVDDMAGRDAPMSYCRCLIVYDRQTNGTFPTISDILQDVDQAGTNSTDVMSDINLNNRDRFTILRDARFIVPSANTDQISAGKMKFANDQLWPSDASEQSCAHWKYFIPLKGLITQYKADSSPAVIGDIATGSLYLITFGDLTAGTEAFEIVYSSRLRFFDH